MILVTFLNRHRLGHFFMTKSTQQPLPTFKSGILWLPPQKITLVYGLLAQLAHQGPSVNCIKEHIINAS